MAASLDHLVVVSPSLESGVAWLEDQLGCSVSPGGSHPRMGTHNVLVKIGPREYIEVIAVDPRMERPNRDRWFGLDRIVPDDSPRLTTWVARTTSMDDAISGGLWPADSVSSMNRGSLNWKITIPSDAEWSTRSHLPLLIEWGDSRHPTDQLRTLPFDFRDWRSSTPIRIVSTCCCDGLNSP